MQADLVEQDERATKRQRFDPPGRDEPAFYQPGIEPVGPMATTPRSRRQLAPVHGNYKAYYRKRRAAELSLDPRLALVQPEWIDGKRVLDVGCNAGAVTIELAQRFRPARVVGVDIDDALVTQAYKNVELAWSMQQPSQRVQDALDTMAHKPPYWPTSDSLPPLPALHHFPVALPRMFGYLSPPPRDLVTHYEEQPEEHTIGITRKGVRKVMARETRLFPENVSFKVANWVDEEISSDRRGYDIIFALSVTKWIHLNSLNDGLQAFFTRIFATLLPGGRFVLEPQPFSTYAQSARKTNSDELKANYERLKTDGGWKVEDGDFRRVLLEEIGFESVEVLNHEADGNGFSRRIEVYTKRTGSWV